MEHKINNLQEEFNKHRAEKDENTNSRSPNSEIVNNKYTTVNVNNNTNIKMNYLTVPSQGRDAIHQANTHAHLLWSKL